MADNETPNDGWGNEVLAGWEDTFSFDSHGDVFIGRYEGNEETALQNGDIAIASVFTTTDKDGDETRVGIWANHDLRKKLAKVNPGTLVRIEYTGDREVHKGLTAMKEFSVQTR